MSHYSRSTTYFYHNCLFNYRCLWGNVAAYLWQYGRSFIMKKKQKYAGFTLLEMLIVLLIISVLILLFVPNLAKHKETVDKKGNEAIVKIVESQIELYTLEKNKTPSLNELVNEGYITKEQLDKYTAEKQ